MSSSATSLEEHRMADVQQSEQRPLRVAVVDDDNDIRDLVGLHLTLDDRFECMAQAASGTEALDLLARPDIDAMVLDMNMPGMTGRDVLRAARDAHSEVRVVAFSADAHTLRIAANEGAAATVLKGSNLDGLIAALLFASAVA
jgi:two-component system invasion response regulator UvrY